MPSTPIARLWPGILQKAEQTRLKNIAERAKRLQKRERLPSELCICRALPRCAQFYSIRRRIGEREVGREEVGTAEIESRLRSRAFRALSPASTALSGPGATSESLGLQAHLLWQKPRARPNGARLDSRTHNYAISKTRESLEGICGSTQVVTMTGG